VDRLGGVEREGAGAGGGQRGGQLLADQPRLAHPRDDHAPGAAQDQVGPPRDLPPPALYKHFPSKDAMLAEMLVSISEELLEIGRARSQGERDPHRALAALVEWHVEFALHNQALIVVQDRDWDALPADARERVRTLQRQYVDLWASRMQEAAPGLGRAEARARAHAVFGLINSTPHSAVLPEGQMHTLLTSMALRALGLPNGR
jgi:AcrR family transcriptional regulator